MSERNKLIKCIVWDLDHTIWDGVLLEDKQVHLKENMDNILKSLDSKGILLSIASKNNQEEAFQTLEELGLIGYFLYPQINWNRKSASLQQIKEELNIGMDSILFIDDDPFERAEVESVHEEVRCMDSADYKEVLNLPEIKDMPVTEDSKNRRNLYKNEQKRRTLELEFQGPKVAFLKSLNMELLIYEASEEHLKRCEELTIRTNQLNSTGITYSEQELKEIMKVPENKLWVCELKDNFGSYGMIGLVMVSIDSQAWNIRLLIFSCRVMSRGLGSIMLNYIMKSAVEENKVVRADFIDTGKNRNMMITYKFSNFKEESTDPDGTVHLINHLQSVPEIPDYIKIKFIA